MNLCKPDVFFHYIHFLFFLLFFLHIFVADIDECETEEANCAHGCHNTLGSYACVCNTAYELGSDGKQCYSEFIVLILLEYVHRNILFIWHSLSINTHDLTVDF